MRSTFLPFLLLLATTPAALAQDVAGFAVGRVLDDAGNPLADAGIVATGPSLPGERTAISDADGYFRLGPLPVGIYQVRVANIGHRALAIDSVAVRLGRTTPLGTLELAVEPVELAELRVVAARPVIDPTSTVVGASIEASQFAALPSARSYRSLVAQFPQANGSSFGDDVNVQGNTGLENMYYIDGVNVTDPYMYAQASLNQHAGTNLPWNFIEAIEVQSGGYEAEYGKALGGNINVITHSGSNTFQWGGFGYFSHDALAATYRTGLADLAPLEFRSWDVGVDVGGPIVKDRLWYYGAYNPKFDDKQIQIPGHGPYPDRMTTHQFAGKLNWQVNERADLALTVFGDPTEYDAVSTDFIVGEPYETLGNLDPLLGTVRTGGTTVSLSGSTLVGDRFLLDGTAYWYRHKETMTGRSERARNESLFADFTTGVLSGGTAAESDFRSRRLGARVSGTLYAGSHTVKAGLEVQQNRTEVMESWKDQGVLERYDDTTYVGLIWDVDGTYENVDPTAYLQDSWRLSDRWRLNAGMRWDGQYIVGRDGGVAQSITDQWQPRLGVIFQPGEPGTQKLFASAARYYLQFPTFTLGGFAGGIYNSELGYHVDPRIFPGSIDYEIVYISPEDVTDEINGLEAEHVDEYVLGYERGLGPHLTLGIQGLHRVLRAAVGTGLNQDWEFVLGNYGRGELAFLPEAERMYSALQLKVGWRDANTNATASYVLSRNRGNYTGQYDTDSGVNNPGNNLSIQLPAQATNSIGLLPNDRTHVLKLSGTRRFEFGLEAGTFFLWQSGTPLNELGSSGFWRPIFLLERGSAGRTPAVWDLNFRFGYDLERVLPSAARTRLVLDILHAFSQRDVVWADQLRYLGIEADADALDPFDTLAGAQIDPNPGFGQAMRFQPPMQVRLGLEFAF